MQRINVPFASMFILLLTSFSFLFLCVTNSGVAAAQNANARFGRELLEEAVLKDKARLVITADSALQSPSSVLQIRLDNQVISALTQCPCIYIWDTTQTSNGLHHLRLVRYDTQANRILQVLDERLVHVVNTTSTLTAASSAIPSLPAVGSLRLHFIALSDDDGSDATRCTIRDLITAIPELNRLYAATGVSFAFSPAQDFERRASTLLNHDFDTHIDPQQWTNPRQAPPSVDDGKQHEIARVHAAQQYPGKIVCFLRHGDKWQFNAKEGHWMLGEAEANYAGLYGAYVGFHSYDVGCFAHELGHYFGLPHTFRYEIHSAAEAATKIREYVESGHAREEGLNAFDNDRSVGVNDTPPDPCGSLWDFMGYKTWGPEDHVDISVTFSNGDKQVYTLHPDRYNIMSYFFEARTPRHPGGICLGRFSHDQCLLIHRMGEIRLRAGGRIPTNADILTDRSEVLLEAENLKIAESHDCPISSQRLGGSYGSSWSNHTQMFARPTQNGYVVFDLPVAQSGNYRLTFYGTYARDYGIISLALDGHDLGTVDEFSLALLPSGPITLETVALKAGVSKLKITVVGKHDLASKSQFGFDCIKLSLINSP